MHGWQVAYNQMSVEFVVKPITNYNQNSVSVYIKSSELFGVLSVYNFEYGVKWSAP